MSKCARCGDELEGNPPSVEEYEQHFGKFRADEVAVVCDDCWNAMHPDSHPHIVEQAMAEHARECERA